MKKKVIELLNEARRRELTGILQYMVEHYELEDQEYGKLASEMKEIAIVEMKHAEELAERILFLGGTPTTELEEEIKKGLSIDEMMKVNAALEDAAVVMYNEAAKICAAEGDHVSKEIFERLLGHEEEHLDRFENVGAHIEKLGAVYLTTLLD